MKKRIVVAMSGGVDSSVAAALLVQKGFEVVGITMCFGTEVGKSIRAKRPLCCGPEAINDARRVANILGIKHYVLNFAKDLERFVIQDFVNEYCSGRTPNPCVRCNKFIKFGALLKKARSLDAHFLATGHYARIELDKKNKEYLLRKGRDSVKEQSYFLYSIDKDILPFILTPLGEFRKNQVRNLARKFNLPVHEKAGSQEICFIKDTDYRKFLQQRLSQDKRKINPGPILDLEGKVLGRHKGIAFYTIGQRQGLGVAFSQPLYIVDINAKLNTITLAVKRKTYCQGLIADNLNFLHPVNERKLDLKVKIRYNQQEVKAGVYLSDLPSQKNIKTLTAEVNFLKPLRSVAPGQAIVFYKRDRVIGGGTIRQGIK